MNYYRHSQKLSRAQVIARLKAYRMKLMEQVEDVAYQIVAINKHWPDHMSFINIAQHDKVELGQVQVDDQLKHLPDPFKLRDVT
jgi:sensor domain CHASE-containing protein